MLKTTYKILKYIYKHPSTTRATLLNNFSDFKTYENTINDYVTKVDKNRDLEQEAVEKLFEEASRLNMPIGEQSEYVRNHMPDIQNVTDNSLISYSTNLNFEEHLEKRRHDRWLFWFPYIVTTVIAIVSVVVQIINLRFDYLSTFICK